MSKKVFRTIDEQIDILKNKGLIVNDYEYTKDILFRENYFFLSGYRRLLMENGGNKKFITGSTFEELYAIFLFDRKIRNIMFKFILIIENNIKSIISYNLSKKYGVKEENYLEPKNFTSDITRSAQVNDIMKKMKRQMTKNIYRHSATAHYMQRYGYIPFWVMVKVLSFGIISELYLILKEEDKLSIAGHYKLDKDELGVYLALIANFRNLCAHEDILYEHRTQRRIADTKYHHILGIAKSEKGYLYGKNDLFALLIMMKQMLNFKEFEQLIFEIHYEIDILDSKINTVPLESILNKIGFPANWRKIIDLD